MIPVEYIDVSGDGVLLVYVPTNRIPDTDTEFCNDCLHDILLRHENNMCSFLRFIQGTDILALPFTGEDAQQLILHLREEFSYTLVQARIVIKWLHKMSSLYPDKSKEDWADIYLRILGDAV